VGSESCTHNWAGEGKVRPETIEHRVLETNLNSKGKGLLQGSLKRGEGQEGEREKTDGSLNERTGLRIGSTPHKKKKRGQWAKQWGKKTRGSEAVRDRAMQCHLGHQVR